MKFAGLAAILVITGVTSGCATLERLEARQEARQLAWTGPGTGPCAWGGITEAAEAHCAQVNFGTEGVLEAVNEKVRGEMGADRNCVRHVEAAARELARHDDLDTTPVYTCPVSARARGECHVSLLVTSADGERYVVDNGAVVNDTVGSDGVATYAEFQQAVDGLVWVGIAPTAQEVAEAIPGFTPAIAVAASGD